MARLPSSDTSARGGAASKPVGSGISEPPTPPATTRHLDLTAEALEYGASRREVFPLSSRKTPRFRSPHPKGHGCRGECGQLGHGFYDATTDPDLIRSWAPWRMIGGRIPPTMIVVDVDPHGGGDHTLARLIADYGPLPVTLTCRSGRGDGGRHLYFLRPPGRLSGVRLKPGLDLLHHTLRYAVLPPSPHPTTGNPYRWEDPTVPVAKPPRWLVTLLRPRAHLSTMARTARRGWDPATGTHLAHWLAGTDPTPRSGRHDRVLWAVCRAIQNGVSDQDLDDIKRAAVELGKPSAEVDDMIAWARNRLTRNQ